MTMPRRDDNERRVARMDVWLDLARERAQAAEDRAHLRFALYWIAYEAAYQVYEPSGRSSEKDKRKTFHQQVTWCAGLDLGPPPLRPDPCRRSGPPSSRRLVLPPA